MSKCPKCQCEESVQNRITWEVTNEIIKFTQCTNCGTVIDLDIERPRNMTLKKVHSAADIRISENEKRNFLSMLLETLDQQNKILLAIATGEVPDDLKELAESRLIRHYEFKTLLAMDDLDYSGSRD
jgi:hypothetical protein